MTDLPAPFRWWATAQAPDQLQAALDAGALGLELGAAALAAPGGLDRVAPLLEVLDEAGAPVLVHPGPAGAAAASRPSWWAAAVPYVTELHAAWWAWADGGRARFPRLPGVLRRARRPRARCTASACAPAAGPGGTVDPLTFVETSSYGTQAVDAIIRVLGIDVVCHGTDRPYAGPVPLGFGDAAEHVIRTANPSRLLAGVADGIAA